MSVVNKYFSNISINNYLSSAVFSLPLLCFSNILNLFDNIKQEYKNDFNDDMRGYFFMYLLYFDRSVIDDLYPEISKFDKDLIVNKIEKKLEEIRNIKQNNFDSALLENYSSNNYSNVYNYYKEKNKLYFYKVNIYKIEKDFSNIILSTYIKYIYDTCNNNKLAFELISTCVKDLGSRLYPFTEFSFSNSFSQSESLLQLGKKDINYDITNLIFELLNDYDLFKSIIFGMANLFSHGIKSNFYEYGESEGGENMKLKDLSKNIFSNFQSSYKSSYNTNNNEDITLLISNDLILTQYYLMKNLLSTAVLILNYDSTKYSIDKNQTINKVMQLDIDEYIFREEKDFIKFINDILNNKIKVNNIKELNDEYRILSDLYESHNDELINKINEE